MDRQEKALILARELDFDKFNDDPQLIEMIRISVDLFLPYPSLAKERGAKLIWRRFTERKFFDRIWNSYEVIWRKKGLEALALARKGLL
jgi:hypothetical protein